MTKEDEEQEKKVSLVITLSQLKEEEEDHSEIEITEHGGWIERRKGKGID